jgi:hypothetical protein
MNTEKMREEFEAWHRIEYPGATLARRSNGEYVNLYVGMCWIGWQASRAAIEVELPKIVDKEWANTHAERSAMREAIGWCKKRIESLGLKVKPC